MEVLALSVCSSVFTSALLTVYRPGSVAVPKVFFNEFADALERCSTYTDCIVVCDVNIHLDCIDSSTSQHFISILDSFGLVNRVHQPTHGHGHQLDVIITRSDRPSPEIQVDLPIMTIGLPSTVLFQQLWFDRMCVVISGIHWMSMASWTIWCNLLLCAIRQMT